MKTLQSRDSGKKEAIKHSSVCRNPHAMTKEVTCVLADDSF